MENTNNNYNNKNKDERVARRDYYSNIFEPLFESLFDYPTSVKNENKFGLMKTDIKEFNDKYEFLVEVPGLDKKEINIQLEDGYLTISTNKKVENEDVDKKGNVLRQERFIGSYKRSYFVGKQIKYSDVDASLNNGILTINIKKPVPEEDGHKLIDIK